MTVGSPFYAWPRRRLEEITGSVERSLPTLPDAQLLKEHQQLAREVSTVGAGAAIVLAEAYVAEIVRRGLSVPLLDWMPQ
jgi:hypothetical protein